MNYEEVLKEILKSNIKEKAKLAIIAKMSEWKFSKKTDMNYWFDRNYNKKNFEHLYRPEYAPWFQTGDVINQLGETKITCTDTNGEYVNAKDL